MIKQYLYNTVKYVGNIYALYYYIGSFCVNLLKLFVRPNDKLILFIAFGGKKFDDSPKAIYEAMLADKRFDNYEIVWAFNNPSLISIPKGKIVKTDTIAYFITALKARVWITNSSVERGLSFKGKHTFYFDTWHGTPIKKMGSDILSTNSSFKGRGKWKVDDFTCQGKYEADIFGNVFQTIGRDRMHVIGLPRNDIYAHYTREYMLSLRREMGISEDKKVILYAPTFREYDKAESMAVKISIPMNLEKWRHCLGDEYVLLFRAHYEVAQGLNIKDDDFVREMSAYPQLEDLMIVSDLLISDYSSIFFDYSIMHKPMLCFVYDYERYAANRGMYFDIRKWLPSATNEDDMIRLIKKTDIDVIDEYIINFQKEFVSAFGDASQKSLDIIAEKLNIDN